MYSITRKRGLGKVKVAKRREGLMEIMELAGINDVDIKVSLIQALIPVGLEKVNILLQDEVGRLAGEPRKHGKVNTRWGSQGGSVYLSDQKVPINVPRVRNKMKNTEVQIEAYQKLQEPHRLDEQLFLKLLNGLSTHKYRESSELVPEVFGISASNVSKRFKRCGKAYLEKLLSRRLDEHDFIALFLDGKTYAKDGIVVAIGITLEGRKVIVGIEQINTENSRSVGQFIDKLIARGFKYEQGLLCVVDGAKGFTKAIEDKFKECAFIQRCQQHKKENVASYLAKGLQKTYRLHLTKAYEQATYSQAKTALNAIALELDRINPSAAASLREGLEETLTLHKLGLSRELRRSFSSTNCIESVLSQVGQYTDKVDRWRNGRHIQNWVASSLMHIEPKLNKVNGWRHLKLLRERMQNEIHNQMQEETVLIPAEV
jgi:putative transposase